MHNIICLMGPTASGKTDLGILLAEHFPIEIVNVDSSQIYQQMDIGSGKPSIEIRNKIPHHLMDILDPSQSYSAGKFCEDAQQIIQSIIAKNKIPLLVGGTMLYFKALQNGLANLPQSDEQVRQRLNNTIQEEGLHVLYHRLEKIDSQSALRIKPTDTQRIQRALEIYEITGKTMSYFLEHPMEKKHNYVFKNIALIPLCTPRSRLHERIELRFLQMLAQGLIKETQDLYQRQDLDLSKPAIRAVGYRQVWQYLDKNISYEQMQEKAIAATRQLAKRQLTWLRSWDALNTFDMEESKEVLLRKIQPFFA